MGVQGLATVLLTFVLAACGTGGGASEHATSTEVSSATLMVERVGELFYDEGTHGFIVVKDGDGEDVVAASFDDGEVAEGMRMDTALSAGRYEIESYMRPCLMACPPHGDLDPPTARCSAELDIAEGQAVLARIVHDGHEDACSIDIESDR